MPHIILNACDLQKNIEILNIHVDVQFSDLYYKSPKAQIKLNELQQKLEDFMEEYFPGDYESEIFSNHEYNVRLKNF